MKALSILIVSLFLIAAKADDTVDCPIAPPGTCNGPSATVLKANSYKVIAPPQECTNDPGCDGITELEVTYTAEGCLDDVIVTALREVTAGGKFRVTLSAVNVSNPDSSKALCVAMPVKTVSLILSRGDISADRVEVVQLDQVLR